MNPAAPRHLRVAAIAGLLILLPPIAHTNAKGSGGKASLITSPDSGSGDKTPPVVRDHRPQVRDHRGGETRTPPRRPICAGWFC